jgi:CRP-like cAMP-binding protein
MVANNPVEMRRFIKLLSGHVHEKGEQLIGIAYNSLRKKVAEALITLHRKYGVPGGQEGGSGLNISRDTLASLAGTAKESLIRTIGDFRDEGLIEIRGTDIVILEEKKLDKMRN